MKEVELNDEEFSALQTLFFQAAGIKLSANKKALITSRLSRRLLHHSLSSYGEYYRLLLGNHAEKVVAVDMLTTNETYFFREPKHFDFLTQRILPQHKRSRPFRVWSAASSSGEEAYTIAMLLAEHLAGAPWEIFGSDISTRMLEKAGIGVYPMERGKGIPEALLRRHCLKGTGPQTGNFMVDDSLRQKVSFSQINLNESLPEIGQFDVIFLRNVLIYFEAEKKQQIAKRLVEKLRPGGYFIVGHSESLSPAQFGLEPQVASIYRKPS